MRYSPICLTCFIVLIAFLGGCKGGGRDGESIKSDELRINIATEPPKTVMRTTQDKKIVKQYLIVKTPSALAQKKLAQTPRTPP